MIRNNVNYYYDGTREIIFHKNPLVELFASLHGMQTKSEEKNESLWLTAGRFNKMDTALQHSLEMYGKAYAQWSLIMDLATYISCEYYQETGQAQIEFDEAMRRFRLMDGVTFLYFFLGMPALGFDIETAEKWVKDPGEIDERAMRLISQYISQKDVVIFIRNMEALRNDLSALIKAYWEQAFSYVWRDIEKNISQAIMRSKFECSNQGDCIQYISNLHNDIYVTKRQVFLKKDITYMIPLDEITQIHIFPSNFSDPELLMDRFENSLIIYYNMKLKTIVDELGEPGDLCNIFKAMGDVSRLKIIKMLWDAPATTQYISNVLGLAASTVSAHLKALKAVGLVNSKTIKKYVYYEVDKLRMQKVPALFRDYIDQEE